MRLGDRYELQQQIARGFMCVVYRGVDTRTDKPVAIRMLRDDRRTDPKFVMRFQREAKNALSLLHPNIVQLYDYGQTDSDGNNFIVMEWVEGKDLRHYVRLRGLRHMEGSVKLISKGMDSTQFYAPEQARGLIFTPATDIYLLGNIMYRLLTGRMVFEGETPIAIAMQHIKEKPTPPGHYNPNIPSELEEIILKCLEKEPEKRFQNGLELSRALELYSRAQH